MRRALPVVWLVATGAVVAAVVGVAAAFLADEGSSPESPDERPAACWGRDIDPAPRIARILGVSTNMMWDEALDPRREFALLASCGIPAVREDLLWEVVEPEPGRYDWERTDRVMTAAAEAGVEILGILGYSAGWASSDPDGAGRHHPPERAADFARYASAVVRRYGPSGTYWSDHPTVTARPLQAVEIWNEPWGWWAWRPDPDPARYAELARLAAEAVRAADPDVKIVVPGDLLQVRRDGAPRPWLASVLDAEPGLLPLIDAYSVHPYPDPRDVGPLVERRSVRWDFGRVASVHETAVELDAQRPIWITEIGWSTADVDDGVTEQEQAEHVASAILRTLREWPFVERLFVYTWAVDRSESDEREARFGLRRTDGSPKPALRRVLDLLETGDDVLDAGARS